MMDKKLAVPGTLLFLDQVAISAGSWAFWLVITRITSSSQIGLAITVYTLVLIISLASQLGLEYTLVKKLSVQRSNVIGTALIMELLISIGLVPVLLYAISYLHEGSVSQFHWISILILFISSLAFVSRLALLGVSDAKSVLIIDSVSIGTRFATGFILVSYGYEASGILIALVLQSLVVSCAALYIGRKAIDFKINMKYIAEIMKDALINTPTKLSRMFIVTISVVLLAFLGFSSSDVGVFYIALMVSLAAGSFASSIAFMAIPASSSANDNLSVDSLRIGLSLTAPIIVALILSPGPILSLIGPEYGSAQTVLAVLSIGILPSIVVLNAISRFNILNQSTKILWIGITQITSFLISFFLLVPSHGMLGGAFAILIAFLCSFVLSVIWSKKIMIRIIAASCASIAISWGFGYTLQLVFASINPIWIIMSGMALALVITIALGNLSRTEMRRLLRDIIKRG